MSSSRSRLLTSFSACLVLALVSAEWSVADAGPAAVSAPGALLEAAQEALAAGQPRAAEGLFRQALASDSDLLVAYRGLAEALAGQERAKEAVEVLLRLGDGLIRAGVHDRAAAALERAVELDPQSASARALFGRALSLERRYIEAARHLERAIDLGESDLRTLLYLGSALWENGRVEDAEAIYRRAVAESRGIFLPLHQLGRLLAWQGRQDEAVTVLEMAAQITDAVDVELDFARALETANDPRCLAAFQRVVAIAPEHSQARYGLARALARSGDREAAQAEIAIYRELYSREQQRVREQELAKARLGKGWELLRQGLTDQALELLEGLPPGEDVLAAVAAARSAQGDPEAAIAALEQAVTLAPERGDLRLRLAEARLLMADGR